MPKRGENIYKRKDGRWEGRYAKSIDIITNKKKYHSIYGKSYLEVKKKLLEEKNNTIITEITTENYTLSEWLTIWLEEYAKLNVKDSTYSTYFTTINNHIIPQIGKILLKDLTIYKVQLFINEKITNGRIDGNGGLSLKTVKDIHTVLSTALKQAVINNFIDKNPCSFIKIPSEKFIEFRVLSIDEQKLLENAVKNSDNPFDCAIMLSLYTGLRLGEICALKWEDINLNEGILYVKWTLQRIKDFSKETQTKTKIIIGKPKSSSSVREIPLSPNIVQYLNNIKGNNQYSEEFFLSNIKGKAIDPRTIQNYFKNIIKSIDIKPATFHTLRHTFATRAIEVGMDIKSVSEILGHADVSITMKRYVHSLTEHKRNQMQKIDMIF